MPASRIPDRMPGNSPVSQPSTPIPEPPTNTDSTVYVNGKPVADNARTSGATKEAAASKTAEQKLAGQAQEAWLREQLKLRDNHQPNELDQSVHAPNIMTATSQSSSVQVKNRPAHEHRNDEYRKDCDDPKKSSGSKTKP